MFIMYAMCMCIDNNQSIICHQVHFFVCDIRVILCMYIHVIVYVMVNEVFAKYTIFSSKSKNRVLVSGLVCSLYESLV